ncbi:MAG: hypothetical protein J6Q65_03205, partial [Lentisphaeria bacterium]|nr:hypothetical protein [Lentisphaeria bacterium]
MTDDRCEQMAFSFFQDDVVKTVKKTSIADQEFDTEEDALFALLGSHTDDTQLPPEDSASGEQFFSAPEEAVETVAETETVAEAETVAETEAVAVGIAEEEKDEAEIERAVAALEQEFGLNNDIADLTKEIVDTVVDIEQEIEAEEEEEAPVIIPVKKKNIFPPLTEQPLRRAALGFLA